MRTTLTLNDDIASALKERARLLNLPFKQVVNDALRRGLPPEAPSHQANGKRAIVKIRTFSSRLRPGYDWEKLKDVLEEEDIERFLRVDAEQESAGPRTVEAGSSL